MREEARIEGSAAIAIEEAVPRGALLRPLVLVGGKGGVGKTTLAAALGLAVAARNPDRKVLLLSTDPAHSLVDALGGEAAGEALPPNLHVWELDSLHVFEEFRARHREALRLIGLRGTFLDDEDLRGFLDLGLPGLDEVAALKVIGDTLQERVAQHVIVDTAPTGHTLRLLELPAILDRWHEALESLMAKHRLMMRLYARGYQPDAADAFIDEIGRILGAFREVLADAERSAFVPVMNADPLSFWETRKLLDALARLGIAAPCLFVNKLLNGGGSCRLCQWRRGAQASWIAKIKDELHPPMIQAPWLPMEPRGAAALGALGRHLLLGGAWTASVPRPPIQETDPRPIETPISTRTTARETVDAARLILVCGKGGVGKTTVSSALALRLATRTRQRILLFSTDPAHSLSDAFGTKVGQEPTSEADRLDAVEIDPEERLRRLRDTYREEVQEFFGSLFRSDHVDTTLDREAMERLIDLSPPGLDEVMALVDITRHVREGKYDKIVVDTAPTGHFLRFLELPEVMRAWIRSFFEIFLKYRTVLRAPKVQACLVALSKDVRDLQGTLRSGGASVLIPVATPTELSFARTRDLLRRTGEMGLTAPVAVLNHLVPATRGCNACVREAASCRTFWDRYRAAFPRLPFLCLPEQGESLVGPEPLDRVGQVLFG